MKEFIYLGKIVNTHGIKGEIRIKSNFLKKDLVFKNNFCIYIGDNKAKETIVSHRVHKGYNMVILKGLNNINEVLKYKGNKVYIKRDDLNLNKDEYIIEDLIGLNVVENEEMLGIVQDFLYNNNNILLLVYNDKKFYIPYNDNFIKNVDLDKKEIQVKNAKELII